MWETFVDIDIHLSSNGVQTIEWSIRRGTQNERVNELMNYTTYMPPLNPEGQVQGCILWRSLIVRFVRR